MKKFKFTVGYEVQDVEVVVEAETEEAAKHQLDTLLVPIDGGYLLGPWVTKVEEVRD